jgi:tRNA-specific 2-thiouridylase
MGQRPMSQRKKTLPVVSAESGAEDLLLRPLCAKNLPETRPEKEGWVDRALLHSITGRSRKPQMALAQQFGFEDYAQPAGGCCFLTDQNYAVKLQDLWDNRGRKTYELDDIMLLKVGRHIRPSKAFKLIIAREEGETRFLSGYKKQFQSIKTVSHAGPLTLIEGDKLDAQQIQLACAITARFSKGRDAESVEVVFSDQDRSSQQIHIKPLADIQPEWYIT